MKWWMIAVLFASTLLPGCASPDIAEIQRAARSGQPLNTQQTGWDRDLTQIAGTVAGTAAASQATKPSQPVRFVQDPSSNLD